MATTDSSKEEELEKAGKLKAYDIAGLLQTKFVFLSGGVDKQGCAILTVPAEAKMSSLSDQEITKVFRYIVSLTSSELKEKGFTFVLDKRKGKWTGVNSTLFKLQKVFQYRVNCVYVLKPQGFLQKFIGGGLASEEAQAAFKIVVLGGANDLLKYACKDQLTSDLGGELSYNHEEWIQHRTAIERLEKTLDQIGTRLGKLQSLFKRTEIISSIEDMEYTLDSQQEMWKDVKEDIASARITGSTLLRCIHPLGLGDENENPPVNPDVKANAAELEALLARLRVSEEEFGRFWVGHERRIRQGLELSLFEQEIGQVTGLVLAASGHVAGMTDVGDSRAAAELLIEELKQFAQKSQDPMTRAENLAARGKEMVENGHYSRDTICLRCDELQQLCTDFNKQVRLREEQLKSAMDIHECLEQVSKWCTKGVDLLASQPVEKFQSSEGAENSLKEIDNFLKDRQGISLKKLNRLEQMSKDLGNKYLVYKVKDCLKRIGEVNDMMAKRESSLKRLVVKRPVQPVAALPTTPPTKEDSKRKVSTTSIEEKKSKYSPKTSRPISIVLNRDEIPSPDFTRKEHPLKSISVPDLLDVTDGVDTPEIQKKRSQVMAELLATEKDYVADLEDVIKGYVREFDKAAGKIPIELFEKKDIIFGNIEEILEFHRKDFLEELQKCSKKPQSIGKVFTEKREQFEKYALYCKNKPSSETLQQQLINLPFIKDCQTKLGHKLPLTAYLLKPVQRITKYQLLLREMMKNTKNDRLSYMDLLEAFHAMQSVLRHLNDVMHSSGLKGFHGNQADLGKLLLQDPFLVWHTSSRRKLPPLKGSQRQVFLYEKMLIFSKREEDQNSKDSVTYHFKNSLKTCDVGITEKIKGAPLRFELWLPGRTEVFLLQANTEEIKERWISEIRRVLLHQFDEVKDSAKWKSTPTLNNHDPSTNRPRAKSQTNLSLEPEAFASRCSDITEKGVEDEYDDDDDFDSDEWSDDSDEFDEESSLPSKGQQQADSIPVSPQVCLAEYNAVEPGEISMKEGDAIEVVREGQGGWWFVRNTNTKQEGWAPASYLEPFNS